MDKNETEAQVSQVLETTYKLPLRYVDENVTSWVLIYMFVQNWNIYQHPFFIIENPQLASN